MVDPASLSDDPVRLVDGQLDWSSGVNSDVPRTKAIEAMPYSVKETQLTWLVNGTVRGGGIGQRPVLQPLVQDGPWSGLYQGGLLYEPDQTDPILLLLIGGNLYRVRVDTDNSVTDLSALYGPGLTMPATQPQAYLAQAEMFGVIQAGDYSTLPLFYDFGVQGVRLESLRRSNGIVLPGVVNPANEIPAAGPMDYFAQRLWYAFDRSYAAGDIVSNNVSGTAAYDFRDSVLKNTENPIAYGGDAFRIPTTAGRIRALSHACNLDTALGETNLFVFTRRAVYACVAPVTREDWTATNTNNMPLQKVALRGGGAYSDRCVVPINSDLFFQSPPNGDVRSIVTGVRSSESWGSVPLSTNESRALETNDRSLLGFATGIQYDNRLLQSAQPIQTPAGVGHRIIVPLDFDVISTFEERRPPAWEGAWDFSAGPYILQMFQGDFGGRERAFAVVWSVLRSQIEVWEIRNDLRFENGTNRVTRSIEYPAYCFRNPFQMKELDSGELWLDKILGTIDVMVQYRPDGYSCWIDWCAFQRCSAKDCTEDPYLPCTDDGYPKTPYCEDDAIPLVFGKPPEPESIDGAGGMRPSTWGFQFQVRVIIRGWCRLRGLRLFAWERVLPPYYGIQTQAPDPML